MIKAKQAIEMLRKHDPIVFYNAHAQEDQIENGITSYDAKQIADLISRQQAVCDAAKALGGSIHAEASGKSC